MPRSRINTCLLAWPLKLRSWVEQGKATTSNEGAEGP